MHYANGREAKLGDVVRGRNNSCGYEFTGVVTGLFPGAVLCNIVVQTVIKGNNFGSTIFAPVMLDESGERWKISGSNFEAKAIGLTCDAKDFVALDAATGDVLPAVAIAPEVAV